MLSIFFFFLLDTNLFLSHCTPLVDSTSSISMSIRAKRNNVVAEPPHPVVMGVTIFFFFFFFFESSPALHLGGRGQARLEDIDIVMGISCSNKYLPSE